MATAKEDKIVRGADLSTIGGAIKNELAKKQDVLVSGTDIKTINNTSLLGPGNIVVQVDGIKNVSTEEDGKIVFKLQNEDTITVDLNHVHSQYPKYVLLESESDLPADPDDDTLYLIPVSE